MDAMSTVDVFPGIVNENEFYSHHFFAHVFQSRIKDWLSQRQAPAADHPAPDSAPAVPSAKALAALAGAFFQQHAAYPRDADFAARLDWHRDLHRDLLQALGFGIQPREEEWRPGRPLPIWATVERGSAAGALPEVVVIPAFNPDHKPRHDEPAPDTLDSSLSPQHFTIADLPASYLVKGRKTARPLAEILSDAVFAADHPPRFVLLVGELEWILIDRFKWPANRVLRFDLSEIVYVGLTRAKRAARLYL